MIENDHNSICSYKPALELWWRTVRSPISAAHKASPRNNHRHHAADPATTTPPTRPPPRHLSAAATMPPT
jgi:hypothetical protein